MPTDTEIVDWIEANCSHYEIEHCFDGIGLADYHRLKYYDAKTLREACAAAMEAAAEVDRLTARDVEGRALAIESITEIIELRAENKRLEAENEALCAAIDATKEPR